MQHQQPIKIKCSKNHSASTVCINENCLRYAFICHQKQCQCHLRHKNCLTIQLASVNNRLNNKTLPLKNLQDCIQKGIQKLVEKLLGFKEVILIEIKKRFESCVLNQVEKELLTQFGQGDTKRITGKKIWQVCNGYEKWQSIKQTQLTLLKMDKTMADLCIEFETKLNQIHSLTQHLSHYSPPIPNAPPHSTPLPLFPQSKIITSPQQTTLLRQFFLPRQLKSTNLLYRASQNSFDIIKFHELCDDVPDTVTVCLTEFGKKVGGYTPVKWRKTEELIEFQADEKEESFLFSVSQGDSFGLEDKGKAVCHRSDNTYGPIFGYGFDLAISNKSNQNEQSFCSINKSYINHKYDKSDPNSWQKFHGGLNKSTSFRAEEWEVWWVQFQGKGGQIKGMI